MDLRVDVLLRSVTQDLPVAPVTGAKVDLVRIESFEKNDTLV
jgi:hypothetical protein